MIFGNPVPKIRTFLIVLSPKTRVLLSKKGSRRPRPVAGTVFSFLAGNSCRFEVPLLISMPKSSVFLINQNQKSDVRKCVEKK